MTLDPGAVPCTVVQHESQLPELRAALRTAERVAIDTEVPIDGPGKHRLRVMSVAVRSSERNERAFVVDVRDLDPILLAPVLAGVTADAWNANFDARVLDAAVWQSDDTTTDLRWWDAQLADALLHQGRTGFTWFHGLAWATEHYLGLRAEGKGTVQLSYTGDGDLTDEQIAYAAADAVETLWVADALRAELTEAGLDQIAEIEMDARPFLDRMERSGLPFDRPGWTAELTAIERRQRAALGHLATLTGGGQGTLFDDVVEPTWNPASEQQVRAALNRFAEPNVLAWTSARGGPARHLSDLDSLTANVLREIGGELCETLLEHRSLTKVLTTYGDSILEHLHDDGRMRPQYLQVVGTNTGRLASRNPNAQNFTPLMKPYVRSADPGRVFVHADLSQAELRYLAQVADDEPLRSAFAAGVDVHVSTAASMFGFDPHRLATEDPERFKHLRQIAKALNFGIAYGTGAAALARSLSSEGNPTTVDEARHLLDQYRRTYPGTAAWAEARIAEIERVRGRAATIDWIQTLKLARGFGAVREVRRAFRKTRHRWPTAEEVVELHPSRHDLDPAALLDDVSWILRYSGPVALTSSGEPFTFSSRTLSGRRQQFNLHVDRLFLSVVVNAIADVSPGFATVRQRFAADHDLDLFPDGRLPTDQEVARIFEDRTLRRRYVEQIVTELGIDVAEDRLSAAARERISAMVNAWRNAPIQGGVADIMLVAFGLLDDRLRHYPTARPVQTVHDSVVIECDRSDAPEIAAAVQAALEDASRRFCPDVRPKADVDIRSSLAEADVLEDLVGPVLR